MSQFLNRVRDVNANDSDAVKETLTAFFQNLPKYKDFDCNRWLRALENVINRFPKYCGQHRFTIEYYLCHFLYSSNYYNVIEAAKCAHAVQQVRPQQERTASAKSCWRDQMSSLCEAAHTLISSIFTKSASIYNRNGKAQRNESQGLSSPLHELLADIDTVTKTDVMDKSAVLTMRLLNVLVFIQAMLVEVYPVAKPVRAQLILEVILQSLSASGNEDSIKVSEIKVQALRTLDAIVACLGSNLIPYSALVFRFVMQTLRWSSEHTSNETRKVRCAAYNSLTKWLNTLRTHRESAERARPWDTELTSHLISDVTPPAHVIQLTPNAQPMKNLSKKARKKLANSLLMQSNISSHVPGGKNKIAMSRESNDELAIAALECTESFLISCGVFLKSNTHKQLQELLVGECYRLEQYSHERAMSLVRALEACRKAGSPKVPPPTQYCLQLYSVLINNNQTEISKFASQALLDIRLHLHCSPPSLNFALDVQPERKTKEDKRKRLSERNRAVLESLLGQERMPSEGLVEKEVITIQDEPSSKRPRLNEDISDKISLSSESAVSIEISDSSSVEEVENDGQLEESTDYIIEPEPNTDTEKVNDIKKTEQNTQDLTTDAAINPSEEIVIPTDDIPNATVENINETDGRIDSDIEMTQADPESTQEYNIHIAKTQLPASLDMNELEKSSPAKSPLSNEVVYDYQNTRQEKVTVFEKMEEVTLPSTSDTDDVQINCGQTVKSSQGEVSNEAEEPEVSETNEVVKENGIEITIEEILENGNATSAEIGGSAAVKIRSNEAVVTVDDMLADFVDEVNDQTQSPTQGGAV